MNPKCPPVTLNVDEVVEAAKQAILKANPSLNGHEADASVHSVGIRGLGRIAIAEPNINASQFVLGFVTLPSVINFATKLMQVGVLLPQADMAVSRGVAAGLTLVGTLISGGKSFLLGAFLGQFPSTLDAIADVAITAIAKGRGKAVNPNVDLHGLGATPEDELKSLRDDLQKLQGLGTETEYPEERAMSGVKFHY